jgi:hypothetical protein
MICDMKQWSLHGSRRDKCMKSRKEMISELRYNLREKGDVPVRVYPFAYDWRMPLDVVGAVPRRG